ncbi:putative phage replisome organizer [Salinisphaera hydrothermalis EPR70]
MDHRKQIRKPMTSKAVSMLVSKLTRMEAEGHNAGDALQESIINGWQGVFPPKAGDRTVSPAARPSQRRVSPSDHEISSYD